jgi:two-component system, LytTR family, response regulator
MTIAIIEDEHLAAKRLHDLILKYDSKIEVLPTLHSIKRAVEWFGKNTHPDLLLCDIQLADGLCFEIFEQVQINCPVIFTTAYDEYALKAFKLNSIDYLLKPIDYMELTQAIAKFEKLYPTGSSVTKLTGLKMDELLNIFGPQYKNRFVVKVGVHLKPVELSDIQYFYSLEKGTYLCTAHNHNYNLDYTLDQLENLTNPKKFFRISRKYLVHIDFIHQVTSYSNSRLRVQFKNSNVDDAIVSREKVVLFKNWLE